MTAMFLTVSLAFTLAGLPPALAAPPSWDSVLVKHAPVIDGKFDDACWTDQTLVSSFRNPETGEDAKVQTLFRVVHDRNALYFAITCPEPDMAGLKANFSGHDDALWSDDCVELMLDPTNNRQSYAHLIVNANGAVYDAWMTHAGASTDMDYESGTVAAAQRDADSWQVEVRVPFSGLRLTAEAKQTWGLNVCRERKPGGGELSCWAPTMAQGFHKPEGFGTLTGLKVNFRANMVSFGLPRLAEPYFEDGKLAGKLLVPSENWSGSAIATRVKAVFTGHDGEKTETSAYAVVPEGRRNVFVPVVVGKPGLLQLDLTVTRRAPELVLQQSRHALDLDLQPVSIEFLKPAYRDAIYASVSDPAIVCRMTVNVPRQDLIGCELRATFNAGVTEMAARTITRLFPTGVAEAQFNSDTVPAGDYLVKAQAIKDGQVIAEGQRVVHKYKPQTHEVVLDNEGRLLVDGRRFFPWGFMGATPDPRLSRAGFNTIHNYNTWYIHRDQDLNAWLDEARSLGLKVVMPPFPGVVGFYGYNDRQELSDKDLQSIRDYVDRYKGHPALLAWYMCDEPRGSLWRMNLEKAYRVVAEADPFHPCVALDNGVSGLLKLTRVGDILWIDPYPGFARGGGPREPLDMVARTLEELRAGLPDKRPVWIAPQAFSYAEWDKAREATEREPSFAEVRCMNYLALLSGADGIIPFAWAYAQKHPSTLNSYLEGLGPEMAILQPAFVSGTEVMCRVVPLSTGAEVMAKAWQYDGSVFVVAVNRRPEEVRARVVVPGTGNRRLRVLAERRFIETLESSLDDVFPPYGVHIYTNRKHLPSLVDLDQIERHIRNDEAARKATW